MRYTLLSKAEVETKVFKERAGMINVYSCAGCGRIVVYLYVSNGITPGVITCDKCNQDAYSQLTSVRQPSRIWYRPEKLEDLENLAENCVNEIGGNYEIILNQYIMHYNKGGLFAKII